MELFKTNNAIETQNAGKTFAETLRGGETVLLCGNLGAGKTQFAKGVAAALGYAPNAVTSPTFTLHNAYEGGRLALNHFDFYRTQSIAEVESLGLDELFSASGAVALIEWSENVAELLPAACVFVEFEVGGENERKITIKSNENR